MTLKEIIKAFEDMMRVGRRLPGCADINCRICGENMRVKDAAMKALAALKQRESDEDEAIKQECIS